MSRYKERRRRGWPYWKLQWYDADPRVGGWRDIQYPVFTDRGAAVDEAERRAAADGRTWRLMRVDRDGREPDSEDITPVEVGA